MFGERAKLAVNSEKKPNWLYILREPNWLVIWRKNRISCQLRDELNFQKKIGIFQIETPQTNTHPPEVREGPISGDPYSTLLYSTILKTGLLHISGGGRGFQKCDKVHRRETLKMSEKW